MMKKILSFLISIIVIISFFYFIKTGKDIYLVRTVSFSYVLLLSGLIIITSLCYGKQLKIIMDHYKFQINFWQAFGITRMTNFTNLYIPFSGGSSFKAIYLKKVHNMTYTSFLVSNSVAGLIQIWVNSFIGIIFIFPGDYLFFLLIFFFLSSVMALFLLPSMPFSFLKDFREDWGKILKDYKTMRALVLVSIFIVLVTTLRIYISFNVFSFSVSMINCLVIAVLTTVTGIINLLPGNLGIREGVIIAYCNSQGIGINEGLHAASLDRLIWTFLSIALTPTFIYSFHRSKKIDL